MLIITVVLLFTEVNNYFFYRDYVYENENQKTTKL